MNIFEVKIILKFPRDNNTDHASRVFITTDLIGQTYLCYLMQNQYRLYLIRLEKSNDPDEIIMGMVTTISAKDAISLPVSFMTDNKLF